MMPFRLSRREISRQLIARSPMKSGSGSGGEGFCRFLAGMRRDALAQGIRRGPSLSFVRQYLPRVIELDRNSPSAG